MGIQSQDQKWFIYMSLQNFNTYGSYSDTIKNSLPNDLKNN